MSQELATAKVRAPRTIESISQRLCARSVDLAWFRTRWSESSCLAEAAQYPDKGISSTADAMAKGALMGARGNSGVILSQIWRGLRQSLRGKKFIKAKG
ncbi:MAG: DAK2 domain-containing protein, partial [bacterium]